MYHQLLATLCSVLLLSLLLPGPKGEGGLDDATGASGAAGGASMKQTSGTVDLSEWLTTEADAIDLSQHARHMRSSCCIDKDVYAWCAIPEAAYT